MTTGSLRVRIRSTSPLASRARSVMGCTSGILMAASLDMSLPLFPILHQDPYPTGALRLYLRLPFRGLCRDQSSQSDNLLVRELLATPPRDGCASLHCAVAGSRLRTPPASAVTRSVPCPDLTVTNSESLEEKGTRLCTV